MKTKLCCALLTVLVPFSATAIEVTHLEDSVTRTWFTVYWGAVPFAPLVLLQNGPLSDAGAMDQDISVHIDAIHPFFSDSFDIEFATDSRLFSTATVSGFSGVQVLPVAGDDYGVQVVYGEPVPVRGSVPDGGGTASLLCLASVIVFWCRHRMGQR